MTDQIPASWHSHVYFDDDSHAAAAALITAMKAHFGADDTIGDAITYGRWHHRPVGPHPDFSIQIEYPHQAFAAVMTFLALHRGGLTIFTHPVTGDDTDSELRDHRDHAIWMGAARPLKLSRFGGADQG